MKKRQACDTVDTNGNEKQQKTDLDNIPDKNEANNIVQLIELSSSLCNQLANLHKTGDFSKQVLRDLLGIPITKYNKTAFHSYSMYYETSIAECLELHFYDAISKLIINFAVIDADMEVRESLNNNLNTKNWLVKKAIKNSPSATIMKAITKYGVYNSSSEYCCLIREFCRIAGVIGLQYVLSECSPLDDSDCSVPVSMSLFLEAINMALEVLDLVSSRCEASAAFCMCHFLR